MEVVPSDTFPACYSNCCVGIRKNPPVGSIIRRSVGSALNRSGLRIYQLYL